ncbi:ligand-binding sensor domain-containing protein [Flavobacterium sp.]|uniref:ligand-binding sensor domain-containing protein n=1 Tax=Flavobacterium sp. TaxID=239 RepID=UPI0039E598F5
MVISIFKQSQFLVSLSFVLSSVFSCNGQKASQATDPIAAQKSDSVFVGTKPFIGPMPNPIKKVQISQYIRRMFQDKAGNIWFGTNGDGVCRFDGKTYTYYNPNDMHSGFGGEAVRGIVADDHDNLWFATNNGVSRYDGQKFQNFTTNDGLPHNQVWGILKDRLGNLWFGTEGGVSRYDGKKFTHFALPEANLKGFPMAYPAPKLVNCLFQDKAGNIWFGTNGNGVYRYDGKKLANLSKQNGLCDNFVQCITQDRQGNLWFGTRFGGLSRYDGKSFANFTDKDGLGNNFIWTFHHDKTGNLWIGHAGGGLTQYNGKTFQNYSIEQGLPNRHVQSLMEDRDGRFWIGTSGGAFQFDGQTFTNILREINQGDGC